MRKNKFALPILQLRKTTIVSLSALGLGNVLGGDDIQTKEKTKKPPIKETEFSCFSCNSALDTCGDPKPIPSK